MGYAYIGKPLYTTLSIQGTHHIGDCLYRGTTPPGDLTQRGTTTLTHRLQCAWSKFHLFRSSLTDKHVDIKLRMRLFNAVVTPSALYGLTACPLTVKSLSTLEVTQRKMLRLMFGWRKHCDQSWEDVHSALKKKLAWAMQQSLVTNWSQEITRRKSTLEQQLRRGTRNEMSVSAFNWKPNGVRPRGRPYTRWF